MPWNCPADRGVFSGKTARRGRLGQRESALRHCPDPCRAGLSQRACRPARRTAVPVPPPAGPICCPTAVSAGPKGEGESLYCFNLRFSDYEFERYLCRFKTIFIVFENYLFISFFIFNFFIGLLDIYQFLMILPMLRCH